PRQMAGPLPPGATMPPGHPTTAQPQARPGPVNPEAALPPGHPSMTPEPDPAMPDSQPSTATSGQDAGPSFGVELDIDPGLAEGLSGSETVFVVARAASGPPTPLAVRRMTVADLPARIGLSDSDAMVDGMNLSTFPEIVITARVSMSGDVQARPGDLQGQSGAVSILEAPSTRISISERL
ncbi:MAG: c-type cytochrome biogenesis protein CcmI/CycH, partial [Wenzhouxiangella sp.]